MQVDCVGLGQVETKAALVLFQMMARTGQSRNSFFLAVGKTVRASSSRFSNLLCAKFAP